METDTTPELVSRVYVKLKENILKYKEVVGRPLTLTEKILSGHFDQSMRKILLAEKIMFFSNPTELHYKMLRGKW